MIIGSGTATNANFPITAVSNYSYTQQIYSHNLIRQAGMIERIRFNNTNFNGLGNSNLWRIFMGHTTKTTFTSNTDWINNFAMTQVFYGAVTVSGTGWQEIILQTPFYYNNTDNLVIAVDENKSGTNTAINWLSFAGGTNVGISYSGDTDSNPLAPQTAGLLGNNINQLQLKFTYIEPASKYCCVSITYPTHTDNLTFRNIGSSSITVNSVSDNASWLTCSLTPQTLLAGASLNIALSMDASALTPSGYYTNYPATVTVSTSAGDLTSSVSLKDLNYTTPVNPRHIAQWEPARGALIRYPLGIPDALVLDLANNADSLYCVVSSTNQATAQAYFQNTIHVSPISKVKWIIAPSDTYWARDWGPISLYVTVNGVRRRAILDYDFNRDSRTNDEELVPAIASQVGITKFFLPKTMIGGNIMTDGAGCEYADEFVIQQNDGDAATGQDGQNQFTEKFAYNGDQFRESAVLYRGTIIDGGYRAILDPTGEYIHHIDCWAKLLSVDRVIIADGMGGTTEAALDNIAAWWATKLASNGHYYTVYRVQCPSNQPYTNSFIMNGHVYIPFWGTGNGGGSTASTDDNNAIAAYNSALSGLTYGSSKAPYTVTGYFRRDTNTNWVPTDAVHCRVHAIYLSDEEPPLPVELSSFTVTPSVHNQALLTWVTQTETNVAGFAIYRGTSETLADAAQLNVFIEATNTSQQQTYVYLDEEVWQSGTYYYWLESRDLDGSNNFYGPISITLEPGGQYTPPVELVTGIDAVYPNPFNPAATVAYTIKTQCEVEILVYNARGQLVRNIMHETKQPGNFRIQWNGLDNNGVQCSSGLYNIVLRAGKERFNRKAVLLK